MLLLLVILFCIWASNIEYIDGEWVNTKKLREKEEAKRREKLCGGPGKPYHNAHYWDKYKWGNDPEWNYPDWDDYSSDYTHLDDQWQNKKRGVGYSDFYSRS